MATTTPYNEPLYYEIAFSFVDAKKEVDRFESFIAQYSNTNVERFLDIGCGPSLQSRELAKRGYQAVGLDSSSQMLEYAEKRAAEEGVRIDTVKADLTDFKLKEEVGFAFIMMGTICYVLSKETFLTHLDSVAGSLKSGGLYLIENAMLDWASQDLFRPESWTMESSGIQVRATWEFQLKDAMTQMVTGTMTLNVNDHGNELVLQDSQDMRMIFPQEFVTLVELNDNFEFVGWFERDSTKPLTEANRDNIVLLRRKTVQLMR